MKAPRRVLHVVNGFLPEDAGGTQLHLRDLALALRDLGVRSEVFARSGGGGELFALSTDVVEGLPVHRLVNDFRDVDRFELLYHHPEIDRRFAALCRDVRPDLVHVHHLTCLSTSILETAAAAGLPVVLTLHDFWLQCPRGQRIHPHDLSVCAELDRARCLPCLQALWPHLLGRPENTRGLGAKLRAFVKPPQGARLLRAWEAFVKAQLEHCDAYIFPAPFHRDRFVEWGLDPGRCAVVEHGLPKDALKAPPRGRKPVERIGFIGTVLPSKGVHVLVEAFRRLSRPELRLEIHGAMPDYHGDRDYGERLQAAARGLGNVHFHGAYAPSELPRILARLDVLVVPSIWWETFCLTAREGVIAGLPVVASDVAGISEAVRRGLVLGFSPGDPEDLACVLRRLLDDADLRDEMSRKVDLVRSIEDCARETLRVYEAACARRGAVR